jgi:hypothetical protein
MEDAIEFRRELARNRAHPARALPPTLPTPHTSAPQNEQSARRELDATRLANVVNTSLQEYTQPQSRNATAPVPTNENEEKAWALVWSSIRKGMQIFFSATSFTIILPVLIAPFIFLFYFVPLVIVNFLRDGKPLRFPIFGITGLITKLKTSEIPLGAAWVLGGILSILLVTTIFFALYALLSKAGELCSFLGTFCSLLPKSL